MKSWIIKKVVLKSYDGRKMEAPWYRGVRTVNKRKTKDDIISESVNIIKGDIIVDADVFWEEVW